MNQFTMNPQPMSTEPAPQGVHDAFAPKDDVMFEEQGDESTHHNSPPPINPLQVETRERRPVGHQRSASGYLLQPEPIMRFLDLNLLESKIQSSSDHLLIVNFIGPKPKLEFLEPYMDALKSEIKIGSITYNHEAG